MTPITDVLNEMSAVYTAIAILNGLLMTLFCVLAVPAIFRVDLRRHPALWILAGALCVAVSVFRKLRAGEDHDLRDLWELINTLLPFVCVTLLTPFRHVWKGLAAALAYVFVEAVKYMILLFFFRSELQTHNDALELVIEIFVHLVSVLLILLLLRRKNEKRNVFEPLLQISPLLYVLIVLDVLVFGVTMVGVSSGFSGTEKKQVVFILLNIPIFTVTVGYAVYSLVKTQTAEKTYKLQLEQQIKHYEMMEKMNEDLRVFRHDLPKKLRPMVAYLDENNVDSAAEIARGLADFSSENALRFHTGNYRLDTVLFCEQQIAQEDGIRIVFTHGSVFPAEGVGSDAIYTIFPNALDNAIEACRKVEGERLITVSSRIGGNTVFVSIKNPCAEQVVLKNGVPQTGKKDKASHGYGIRSIKKAAAGYGDDNVEFLSEDGVFELRLTLRFC